MLQHSDSQRSDTQRVRLHFQNSTSRSMTQTASGPSPMRKSLRSSHTCRFKDKEAPAWVPESMHWLWKEPDRTDWGHCRTGLARILETTGGDGETCIFDVIVGTVIILNVVVLILEIDLTVDCEVKSLCTPGWIEGLDVVFIAFYTVELFMRIGTYRGKFFTEAWSWLDLFIVVSAYLALLGDSLEEFRRMQLFRLVRVARVIRMAKIVSRFPTLNTMIRGFRGAMQAMFWGLVLIMFLIIVWSILAVQLVHPISERIFTGLDQEYCRGSFGTVIRATLFFFQTLIAADAWGDCAIPLIREEPVLFILFAAALVSLQLGFTNLVLAIIVDQAAEARHADQEDALKEKTAEKNTSMKRWGRMVDNLDSDGNGSLSLDELLQGQDDQETNDLFTMMDMDEHGLKEVFSYLDLDDDGTIHHNDFVEAFHKSHTQDMRVYLMVIKLQLSKVRAEQRSQFEELRQLILDGKQCDASKSRGERSGKSPPRTPQGQRRSTRKASSNQAMVSDDSTTISAGEMMPPSRQPKMLLQDEHHFSCPPQAAKAEAKVEVASAPMVGGDSGKLTAKEVQNSVPEQLCEDTPDFAEYFRGFEARLSALAAEAMEMAETTSRSETTRMMRMASSESMMSAISHIKPHIGASAQSSVVGSSQEAPPSGRDMPLRGLVPATSGSGLSRPGAGTGTAPAAPGRVLHGS